MIVDFYKRVERITQKDNRYKPDAYEFIMQALEFTQGKLKRTGHVTGGELLDGIREYGLEQYGPMTKNVFSHWGVLTTDDFGEIVFNLVENGLMGKTEGDSRKDFKNIYDFKKVFDSKRQFEIGK